MTQMVLLLGKTINLAINLVNLLGKVIYPVYPRTPQLSTIRNMVIFSAAEAHHENYPWWFLEELSSHMRTFQC